MSVASGALALIAACDSSSQPSGSSGQCFSILQPPSAEHPPEQGCDCVETPASRFSYCLGSLTRSSGWSGVNEYAVISCAGLNQWSYGLDGVCVGGRGGYEPGSCAKLAGTIVDGGTCPSGFAMRVSFSDGTLDAGAREQGLCCYPVDVTRENCNRAGLSVVAADGQDQSLGTRCGNGGALRGFVVGERALSLCCAAP